MSITQEPPAIEVLCFQCSGIGKLRITFGDPPQWAKCGKCGGTGKLHRSGGSFVGALPDLSAVVLEEKAAFGKRNNFGDGRIARQRTENGLKDAQNVGINIVAAEHYHPPNFEQCGVESRHASPEKSGERHGSIPCVVTGTDIRVGLASDHCSIPLCQTKVAMIHKGGRYCAKHGMEVLK